MIVTCEKCTTQFKLDDAKIPPNGARVRCSRCQHAFFIQPSHQDDHARIDDLTRDVFVSEPVPETAADHAGPGDEVEADWKFNEDAPASEESESIPDLDAAREAVDDLLGSDAPLPTGPNPDILVHDLGGDDLDGGDLDLDSSDLDLDSSDLDLDSGHLDLAGPELGASESSAASESGLDLGSDSERLGPEAQIEPDSAPTTGGAAREPASTGSRKPDLTSVVDALAGGEVDDDLGSPQSWDFFEQEESEKTPVARVELVPRWKLLDQERDRETLDVVAAPELEDERGPVSRTLRHVGTGLGWSASIILIAAGVWSTLGAGRSERALAPPVQRLGDLEAEVVAARWIDNAVAGPIYVMSGELRSTRPGEPIAVGRLGIELLDDSGEPLEIPPTPVATPIHPVHLRERAPAALVAELEAGARELARNYLRSGDALPFQAILASLPPDAVRFRLIQGELAPQAAAPAGAEADLAEGVEAVPALDTADPVSGVPSA